MGWFNKVSNRDLLNELRAIEAIHKARHLQVIAKLNEVLTQLTNHNATLNKIMATQAELAAELAAKTAQIRKAINEITDKLAMLEEAVRNTPANAELTEAVAALGEAVQAADDIVPDTAPENPV